MTPGANSAALPADEGSNLQPVPALMRRVLADWPEIKSPRMTLRQHVYRRTVDVAHCRQRELRLPPERPAQRAGYRGPGAELNWAEIPTR